MLNRCNWAGNDPLYIEYHDKEWGVPVHDDKKLFEFIILEGAQAGLSWLTILKRRENYRKAFADFDTEKVALFNLQLSVAETTGNCKLNNRRCPSQPDRWRKTN
jgi:DNA-3-methyladenine glycosylase I